MMNLLNNVHQDSHILSCLHNLQMGLQSCIQSTRIAGGNRSGQAFLSSTFSLDSSRLCIEIFGGQGMEKEDLSLNYIFAFRGHCTRTTRRIVYFYSKLLTVCNFTLFHYTQKVHIWMIAGNARRSALYLPFVLHLHYPQSHSLYLWKFVVLVILQQYSLQFILYMGSVLAL